MMDENTFKSGLVLEIENTEKVKELLTAFNSDFEILAKHLSIKKSKLKIRRPQLD